MSEKYDYLPYICQPPLVGSALGASLSFLSAWKLSGIQHNREKKRERESVLKEAGLRLIGVAQEIIDWSNLHFEEIQSGDPKFSYSVVLKESSRELWRVEAHWTSVTRMKARLTDSWTAFQLVAPKDLLEAAYKLVKTVEREAFFFVLEHRDTRLKPPQPPSEDSPYMQENDSLTLQLQTVIYGSTRPRKLLDDFIVLLRERAGALAITNEEKLAWSKDVLYSEEHRGGEMIRELESSQRTEMAEKQRKLARFFRKRRS